MSEEEIIKLRTRLQLAEDSNKILVQKLKNKDKDLKTAYGIKEYLKQKDFIKIKKVLLFCW